MGKKVILNFIFLFFISLIAKAQISVGGFTGFMFPIGNNPESLFFDNDKSTTNYRTFSKGFIPMGISIKYQPTKKLTIGASYQNTINFNESRDISNYRVSYSSDLRSFNLNGNILLGSLNKNNVQLFAGLNLGYYNANLEKDKATNQIFEVTVIKSINKLGFGPQVGLKYILSDKISWESALKYNFIVTSEMLKSSASYNMSNSQIIGIETGLDFNF